MEKRNSALIASGHMPSWGGDEKVGKEKEIREG